MTLLEKLMNKPVSSLDLRELVKVRAETTVRQTITAMRNGRQGCAAVLDEDDKPLGKFTERRLIRLLLANPGVLDEPVGAHMRTQWAQVRCEDHIMHLIDSMEAGKFRFICIVDDEGCATKLIGQRGVVKWLAAQFPQQVEVQSMNSKMHMDQREGA
jgi:predicted transcriptional regulator